MRTIAKAKRSLIAVIILLGSILFVFSLIALDLTAGFSASADEIDYSFETVPIESITLSIDGDISEIQPRQSFEISYVLNPWYTTVSQVYYVVSPATVATVSVLETVRIVAGVAVGRAMVTVSSEASVGSTFSVIVSGSDTVSNIAVLTVAKVPVTSISLTSSGSNDRLQIGQTRDVSISIAPSYATYQNVTYQLSGTGTQYVDNFNTATGVLKAKSDIETLDVNSTVTITASSVDNPNLSDSITFSLYIPTTIVQLSATTPRGTTTPIGDMPLAVASSAQSDTVQLNTTINGIPSYGLNYVIVSGQEYVLNGIVRADGSFDIKTTVAWTNSMTIAHAKIRIMVAYSDGYDEITISIYVPVENISFTNTAPSNVENARGYDLIAQAYPKYATCLADQSTPISYTLNGLSSTVASVSADGFLTIPKSLTSKGTVINYSAYLVQPWIGVDTEVLTHTMKIAPVYATGFDTAVILKNGTPIDAATNKVLPNDNLTVAATYTIDNVTELSFSLSTASSLVSIDGSTINIAALELMNANYPSVNIRIGYNDNKGNSFFYSSTAQTSGLDFLIYVPARDVYFSGNGVIKRGTQIDLKTLITINHGVATNLNIIWNTETPFVSNAVEATCSSSGILWISTKAVAGTSVRVQYKTEDDPKQDAFWREKEFLIAHTILAKESHFKIHKFVV
jgi:hypothetical protein